MRNCAKILKFAELYRAAAHHSLFAFGLANPGGEVHQWAAGIVNQAFQQVMGRAPTPPERQIVMAVSDLESGYGRGWGKGQSSAGQGSHNWGAVQTRSQTTPGFSHQDSSAEGKYQVRFKAYPDDVAGSADVVRLLFKGERKQQMPDPNRRFRTMGGPIEGPGRGELIEAAAQQGDTLAFSRTMWYTTYFEGFNEDFTKNIRDHAQGIQSRINRIAASLGEAPAWSIKSDHYLPVTNDRSVIDKIIQMKPEAAGSTGGRPQMPQQSVQSPSAGAGVNVPFAQPPAAGLPGMESQDDFGGIESMIWFQ
jgi:hypothetical protein